MSNILEKNKDKLVKNKEYDVINSCDNVLRIYVKNKTKHKDEFKYESTVMVAGLFYFDCEFSTKELIALEKYFPLFCYRTKEILSEESIQKCCIKISTNNQLPLYKLIYLFHSTNVPNLSTLIEKVKQDKVYLSLEKETDKSFAIINQIYLNRESLLNYLSKSENNLNKWAFSNGNLTSSFSRIDLIKNLIPSFKQIESYFREEYENCNSFEELYSVLTSNKKVLFEKELKRYIQENLFHEQGYVFLNTNLFEQIITLFEMNAEDLKSLTELEKYLAQLKKISFDKIEPFSRTSCNIRRNLVNFCSMFKEKPLEVLKRSNIPYHLYEGKIEVLNKYYKNNDILSIEKEKKLYYFMSNLSKRMSKELENEELLNPNNNFNKSRIYSCNKYFSISTVKDTKELFNLGIELSNCAGNLENMDFYQNHYNYVIRANNKTFLGLIKNGEFDQLKGYKNASPSYELFLNVLDFLKEKGYIREYSENELEKVYNKHCIHTIWID